MLIQWTRGGEALRSIANGTLPATVAHTSPTVIVTSGTVVTNPDGTYTMSLTGSSGGTNGGTNGGTGTAARPATSALTDSPPVLPAIRKGLDLGPACQQCGGMMQRTGSCYTCSSCGFNTGCG